MRSSFAAFLSVIILSTLTGCKSGGSWGMPSFSYSPGAEEAPLHQPNQSPGSPTLPSQKALAEKAPATQLGTPTSPASYNQANASNKYNTGIYGEKTNGNQNQLTSGSASLRKCSCPTLAKGTTLRWHKEERITQPIQVAPMRIVTEVETDTNLLTHLTAMWTIHSQAKEISATLALPQQRTPINAI